jgi:hypothetical protein
MPANQSEAFVLRLCQETFLSLWSHPNPRGKGGKELCDILVVCEPDIVVVSVKEVAPTDSGDTLVDWKRWHKRAIEASAMQACGAARWLRTRDTIQDADNNVIRLPPPSERRTHLVAAALGGQGKAPLVSGDFGKGFVHVFDEESLNVLMQELDTITDFTRYLRDKETLLEGTNVHLNGGEEDLLAVYLHRGRTFPAKHDHLIIEPNTWADLTGKPEYARKEQANRESYWWDGIIETFCEDFRTRGLEFGSGLSELETVVRAMAREDRFARRILGQSWKNFMDAATAGKVAARLVPSPSGVIYVFLATPRGIDREVRRSELALRCFVARGLYREASTVVGLATERYEGKPGFSFDAVALHMPEWSGEAEQKCRGIQEELGYFAKPAVSQESVDEYPEEV